MDCGEARDEAVISIAPKWMNEEEVLFSARIARRILLASTRS